LYQFHHFLSSDVIGKGGEGEVGRRTEEIAKQAKQERQLSLSRISPA